MQTRSLTSRAARRDTHSPVPISDLPPALSDFAVVVPTKNEGANVEGFLASLPDAVRLVVVDSSTDDTVERIRAQRPRNTLVVQEDLNIPLARERGAGVAGTRYLLFTDADVEFEEGYFEKLLERPFPSDLGGIVGRKIAGDGYPVYDRLFVWGQRLCTFVGIPAASGSNMLIATAAWQACGGFDPVLTCNEDTEIMWRVKRAGYRVDFAEELRVHERDDRRLRDGSWKKLLHSTFRCVTLYLGILPERWRRSDWGYWQSSANEGGE